MPSQSVEAATRDEAIAAAREEYGPSVKILGVRRIRSGGVLGFFAAERYVAEVDLTAPRAEPAPATRRADDAPKAPRRAPRARATEDERMDELTGLFAPASGDLPVGLYSSAGVTRTPAGEDVLGQRRPRTTPSADDDAALRSAAASRTQSAARSAAPARAAAAPAVPDRDATSAREALARDAASALDAFTRDAAPARATGTPRTAAPASRGASPVAPGRFAAAVQAAAAAPASPFTPSKYRPTLDRLVEPTPEPAVAAAPAGPSPFTAALARMVADRQVSSAVSDAVERSAAADAPLASAAEAPAEDHVFRVPADEWVEDGERIEAAAPGAPARQAPTAAPAPMASAVTPVAAPAAAPAAPAPAAEAPRAAEPVAPAAAGAPVPAPAPAAAPAPVAAPAVSVAPAPAPQQVTSVAAPAPAAVPADSPAEAGDAPRDKRAALQSALQSALRSAGSADEDVERLLEGVLERVLSGESGAAPAAAHPAAAPAASAAPAPQVDVASLTQEYLGTDVEDLADRGRHRFPEPAPVSHPVTQEMPAVRPADHRADRQPAALTADQRAEEPAQLVDDRSADDRVAAWADVRSREPQVLTARRDVVLDVRGDEVLAHREPLVMTPSMAAWPSMARTASDPAPLSMDHTTILPPLSLLPPQRTASVDGMPPLLRGRPAVPPSRRPLASGPSTASRPAIAGRPAVPAPTGGDDGQAALEVAPSSRDVARTAPAVPELGPRLATVTRLVPLPSTAMTPYGPDSGDELVVRLLALGLPEFLIAPGFASDAAVRGLYAALTRTLAERLAPIPEVPAEPGSVLIVVGPGPETLAAARSLAVSVRLDPARVQWATPGDAATLVPEHSRITTLETAADRQRTSAGSGTVTIVAVDAPLRAGGGGWLTHMLSIWTPDAVWGVVDATRKPEDVVPWLDALPRLDAVVVQEIESTADPAAVLSHLTAPVARIDGARATAHRWASLLCERLEEMDA